MHGVCVGKWYICDTLFKLSLMYLSSNKISTSSSLIITNVQSRDMCDMLDQVM